MSYPSVINMNESALYYGAVFFCVEMNDDALFSSVNNSRISWNLDKTRCSKGNGMKGLIVIQ